MAYSKRAFASQLGISKGELERRAAEAGFDTTEGYYRSNQWKGGGSGGGSADFSKLMEQQTARESDFLNRYSKAIQGLPSLSDISGRLSTELGLPQARENVRGLYDTGLNLEGQLASLGDRIKSESRGFDVNAMQRARMEEQRGGEIAKNLADVSRAGARASSYAGQLEQQLGERLGMEQADIQRSLQPFMAEASILSDRAAREITGFTTQMQDNLSRYLADLQNNQIRDSWEFQRLADLAIQENEFENQKSLLEYQYQMKDKYKTGTGVSADAILDEEESKNYSTANFVPYGGTMDAPYSPISDEYLTGYRIP